MNNDEFDAIVKAKILSGDVVSMASDGSVIPWKVNTGQVFGHVVTTANIPSNIIADTDSGVCIGNDRRLSEHQLTDYVPVVTENYVTKTGKIHQKRKIILNAENTLDIFYKTKDGTEVKIFSHDDAEAHEGRAIMKNKTGGMDEI
jgi:hypothetical protein